MDTLMDSTPRPVAFTLWPARQEGWPKALFAASAAASCLALSAWAGGSAWWGLFSLVVLLFALSPYFLPTFYRVEHGRLVRSHLGMTRRLPLSRFQRVRGDGRGIWLLPPGRGIRARAGQLYLPVHDDILRCDLLDTLTRQVEGGGV